MDKLNRRSRLLWSLIVGISTIILGMLVSVCPARAQSTYGAITGTVTDSSGATLADAQVTLTSLATAEKRTQPSGSDGLYSFVNLNPGRYRIDVEKSGFKHTTSPDVVVAVQQTVRMDLAMQVGEVSQTVEVISSAGTPLLQPETSSLGQVVEGRSANELPLNGRNVFSLVSLAPSVVMQGGTGGTITGQNPFSWGNFQIGGAFANQSVEYLDGQPLNIGYINLPVFIPTQDSIAEFKVQTNNVGAEWGKLAGGVLNLSTKGGSNEYHGEAYEFGRWKKTSANDFFSNLAGRPRPPLTQNQFGGNFGGSMPYLKRTFFFFSYEGFRVRQGLSFTATVPTLAERNGDLSALVPAGQTLRDPCNGAATCPSSQSAPSNATFAGNVIPANRLNATSLALLKLFPLPNTAGNASGNNNFTSSASGGGNQNQWVGRLDHDIGSNQHIYGRITAWDMVNLPFDPLGTGVCPDRCTELFSTQAGSAGYNYTINPRSIFNVTLSISRFHYDRSPINSGFDFATLGWPAAFNSQVPTALRTQPTPCIPGFADNAFCGQGLGSGIIDRNTQYNLSPSFTYIRGRHTLVMGGQVELGYDNYTQTNIASGAFGFTGQFTQAIAPPNVAPAVVPFADFLLGWANNPGNVENHFFGAAVVPNLTAGRQTYWATYVSDTYHLTNKLTLNLGLRYDYQGPWIERFNRQSFFDPTAINPLATITDKTSGSSVGVPGAVVLVNTPAGGKNSRFNQDPNRVSVAPRIGLAYQLNPKTVVRTGYGIFWIPNVASFAVNPLNDPVNSIQTQYLGSVTAGVPINTITTPWPKFIAPPGRDPSFQAALLGQSITIAQKDTSYGYTQQWNLDVQRELPAGFVLDVAYAGTKGTHLPQFSQQVNQLNDSTLAQAAAQCAAQQAITKADCKANAAGAPSVTILQTVPNPFFSVASPGSPLSSPSVAAGQLLRPFPEYAGVAIAGQGSYDSIYHSLQITGTRRFGSGGTLVAAYTWSKLISNTDTLTSWLEGVNGGVGGIQDNNNLRGERSLSSQDVPHHLTVHYVLDLPIGRNKMFLSGVSGITNKIVSGWGVDGVATFQTGFPLNFSTASNPFLGQFGAGLRPNVIPGCKLSLSGSVESRLGQYFNTSCFTQPAAFTFGNEPRVDAHLRGQGIINSDFAIFKTTSVGPSEKYRLQFRSEFFNLFNRPQFAAPNTTFGSSSFGVVNSQVNSPRLVQFALKLMF